MTPCTPRQNEWPETIDKYLLSLKLTFVVGKLLLTIL